MSTCIANVKRIWQRSKKKISNALNLKRLNGNQLGRTEGEFRQFNRGLTQKLVPRHLIFDKID